MLPETDRRIALVMAALRQQRRAGILGDEEPVTPEYMASLSEQIEEPVSTSTFLRIERLTLAKLALSAHSAALRSHLIRP